MPPKKSPRFTQPKRKQNEHAASASHGQRTGGGRWPKLQPPPSPMSIGSVLDHLLHLSPTRQRPGSSSARSRTPKEPLGEPLGEPPPLRRRELTAQRGSTPPLEPTSVRGWAATRLSARLLAVEIAPPPTGMETEVDAASRRTSAAATAAAMLAPVVWQPLPGAASRPATRSQPEPSNAALAAELRAIVRKTRYERRKAEATARAGLVARLHGAGANLLETMKMEWVLQEACTGSERQM